MILTDSDISECLETKRNVPNNSSIVIHPFEEKCLSPVGYDLRVGDEYQFLHEGVLHHIRDGEKISIPPGETISIRTLEWVAMPQDGTLSGLITSRVMLVASGASHVSTSVDPDWVGHLLISFTNLAKTPIELPFGERICTLVFVTNRSKPKKLSQHPPGRPDALNQNASRIADKYRRQKASSRGKLYAAWLIFGTLYAVLLFLGFLFYGANNLFVAITALSVVVAAFGMEVLKHFLNDKEDI